MSCGLKVDDQKKYDASKPSTIIATITQPETPPDLTAPSFISFNVRLTTTKMDIYWTLDSKASP